MQGKVCVVTGANSGIGKVIAADLAGRHAKVILVCRSEAKGMEARDEIRRTAANDDVHLVVADMGSQRSVREASRRLAEERRIDVLVNNAGIYLPKRTLSEDGREMMLAVNHLGPFLMTNLLLDGLAGGRVVTVASNGHRFGSLDLSDLDAERGYVPLRQYGVTKLCNVLFSRELARRGRERGIVASCFHPGAVATGFAQDEPGILGALMKVGRLALRTPAKGAETGIHLATAGDAASADGRYFVDGRPARTSAQGRDDGLARELWELSARLTGLA